MLNNKRWQAFLLLVMSIVILAACNNDSAAEDKVDVEDAKEEPASEHRIVAGTVVIAEILEKLNLDAIAIPETIKELPERFNGLTTIGNAMEPDMEIVKSLGATDVLSVSTLEYDLIDKFEQLNIPVTFLDFQSVSSLLAEVTMLGERYDRVTEAEELVTSIEQSMEAIEMVSATKESPRVLILLGIPGSYLVGTEHSYVGDLVKRAGGVNAIENQDAEYLSSNTEYLHTSNPDIILRMSHGMPEEVVEMFNEEFKTNDVWKHFDAVKNEKVYDLEEELFGTTASLQAPVALGQLMEIFYRQ